MNKKKILISTLALVVLAGLVFLQVRTWRKFEWGRFLAATQNIRLSLVFAGAALIYIDYYLRAVRWKILLRPVRQTQSGRLLAPTIIGFTGLSLLGRPGELIRPYLIARRENLPMASQMAVWTVERIFDMGAFALIMAVNILVAESSLRQLPGFQLSGRSFAIFKISGFGLLGVVAMAAGFAFTIRKNPEGMARLAEGLLQGLSKRLARAVSHRVRVFGEGLNTLHDFKSFLQAAGLSLVIWLFIGLSYVAVTRAYDDPILGHMTLASTLLLTAGSVAGGLLQLPMVGGGSQLATIGILQKVFNVPPETATSCGIMLWLVTFMSIVPAGLALAHREHVSFMRVEEESEESVEAL